MRLINYVRHLATDHKFTAYGSLFFTVPGVYASAPIVSAWMANNSEPHYRRATSIAMGFVATNAVSIIHNAENASLNIYLNQGGILSTWRFPTNEGPRFTKTTIMDLVLCDLSLPIDDFKKLKHL